MSERGLVFTAVFSLIGLLFLANDKIFYYQGLKKVQLHKHPPIGVSNDSLLGLSVVKAQDNAHKVVSIHNSKATNWDYTTGHHWQRVDQTAVNEMFNRGLGVLTGKTNIQDAWRDLIPYQTGESVLIKLNFNSSFDCNSGYDDDINPVAETTNAIIDGLKSIGVPGNKIWITDPSRQVPARFREMIKEPNVQYYTAAGCSGVANYHTVNYVSPNSLAVSVATCPAGEKILPSQVFVNANHLINVPMLKSHGSYVTLSLKNHYGSVLYEHYDDRHDMHAFFNEGGNSGGCPLETKNILADINNNPQIKNKTRLIIGEGLFGNAHISWAGIERWKIFGNDDPNILFFSTDPVAVDSVMTDYIMAERGWQNHEMMHAAAFLGLGVHEHWNNFADKKYTAIDYVAIDLDTSPSDTTPPAAPSGVRVQ